MVPRVPAHSPRCGRGRRAALTLLLTTFFLGLAAPALAGPTPVPSPLVTPGTGLDIRSGTGGLTQPVSLVLLLGALSLLPGLLIMVTAFTRIVIVLGFTRSALGTQGVPPNQVLIGLAMFLTFFVMGPVFSQANHDAVQPFLKGTITQQQAIDKGLAPFRTFMLKQVREKDLQLFVDLSGKPAPATPAAVATTTLVPAYVISELRAAFLIGFVVFIPFIVIDLVVSAALSAMGMAMLPPSLISLPFKLLLFVAVDGWYLVVSSLVRSFH
ncbi:MAG: flagellar biosynthetic protein FliP [Frankiales bacterium]|nr:flagellar biosynthetic protein FliP [Frankiales bacterium]